MNLSDQIRKALRDCGEPMTLAQLADANGWDAADRGQASKNLYAMKKAGEVVTTVAEEKVHFALVAGHVPGRRANGSAAGAGSKAKAKAAPKGSDDPKPAKQPKPKAVAATKPEPRKQINGAPPPASPKANAGSFAQMAAMFDEVSRATKKFPTWPNDPLHALAVLGEEFGELTKAVLQRIYEPGKATAADIRMEALQTAAMSLRFLMSLEHYEYSRGQQHVQAAA